MTNKTFHHWKKVVDEDNIAWLHLDRENANANTLSSEVMKEFEQLLEQLEQHVYKGVVILSDKKSGFIAGADVNEFLDMTDEDKAFEYVEYCQSLFNRLEQLPCPTVALINGFCMGGGTEMVLACNYRIAEDELKTRIGLPEINLGIHPGFGGVVRSTRLLSPLAAMDMMLTGRPLSARAALRIGLVNYVVPDRHMVNAARKTILHRPRPVKAGMIKKLLSHRIIRPLIAQQMRKRVMKRASKAHYPAPYALIELWEKYAGSSQMMQQEARSISKLIGTDTAQNLIHVFFLQNGMKETGKESPFKARHVHVIGAGIMGGDIACWCALKGLTVTLQDQSPERIAPAIKRAARLFRKKLKIRHRVTAAMDRLIPDPDGYGLKNADVIIEAIFEDLKTKQELFKKIESAAKPDALFCTNTSSIPLNELGSVLENPSRLVGLHFFNPVEKMQLIEIVHDKDTNEQVTRDASSFATQIGKLPLKVKSSPGFLVNRVLMPYLLEAAFMVQEGISPTLIDKAALDFGMPMGPVELADKVGLDICLSVAEILTSRLGGEIPDILHDRVSSGNLGIKTDRGFYEYRKGKPVKVKAEGQSITIITIQDRLVFRLMNEAVTCLREGVVDGEEMLDAGIIFGTGFAPFTGGPLKYLHTLKLESQKKRFEELNSKYGGRFVMDKGWEKLLC
ncbi:MAG TPA: crotonase [Gammaproteobacteria bacterium]|mgnify:CR=1 FL=1|nr:crotonase [Gammaproteobacteria bacterium]